MSNPELENYVPNPDKLDRLCAYQLDFMSRLGVPTIHDEFKTLELLTSTTLPIAFALLDEVHEFVRELNWKPWKQTKKPVDMTKVHQELIDCWFFLLELSLMWGLDSKKIMEEYEKKLNINHKRQDSGY